MRTNGRTIIDICATLKLADCEIGKRGSHSHFFSAREGPGESLSTVDDVILVINQDDVDSWFTRQSVVDQRSIVSYFCCELQKPGIAHLLFHRNRNDDRGFRVTLLRETKIIRITIQEVE